MVGGYGNRIFRVITVNPYFAFQAGQLTYSSGHMTLTQHCVNVDATYDVASTFMRHCINVMCQRGGFVVVGVK